MTLFRGKKKNVLFKSLSWFMKERGDYLTWSFFVISMLPWKVNQVFFISKRIYCLIAFHCKPCLIFTGLSIKFKHSLQKKKKKVLKTETFRWQLPNKFCLYHVKISYPREICVFSDTKVTSAFTRRIKFFGIEQFFLNINKNISMNVIRCAFLKSLVGILPETTIKAVRPQSRENWNLEKVWQI